MHKFAKTHKFDNINDVNLDQLKFRPIMDQTGTIKDTLQFPQLLKDLPPLKDDKEYVSYDVESSFTNIRLKETTDYILPITNLCLQ